MSLIWNTRTTTNDFGLYKFKINDQTTPLLSKHALRSHYIWAAGVRRRMKACLSWRKLGTTTSLALGLGELVLGWVEMEVLSSSAFRSVIKTMSGSPGGGSQGSKTPWVPGSTNPEDRWLFKAWRSNQHIWQHVLTPMGQSWVEWTSWIRKLNTRTVKINWRTSHLYSSNPMHERSFSMDLCITSLANSPLSLVDPTGVVRGSLPTSK